MSLLYMYKTKNCELSLLLITLRLLVDQSLEMHVLKHCKQYCDVHVHAPLRSGRARIMPLVMTLDERYVLTEIYVLHIYLYYEMCLCI